MERPGRAKQPATGLPALPSLVRHILLLAVSLAAVATSESTEEKLDFYDKLVSSPSRLSRNIKKAGMIPYELWDDKIFSFNPFHQWLLNTTVHRYNVSRNYPLSFPCGVWVNHHYKVRLLPIVAAAGKCCKRSVHAG